MTHNKEPLLKPENEQRSGLWQSEGTVFKENLQLKSDWKLSNVSSVKTSANDFRKKARCKTCIWLCALRGIILI